MKLNNIINLVVRNKNGMKKCLLHVSGNGYIEAGELDDFLAALCKESNKEVN